MSYIKATNFAVKDTLPSGDPNKIVRGTEIDTEFNALQTSIGLLAPKANPSFTGTAIFNAITAASATINGTTIPASATLAKTADKLSVFAATTSAELAGVITNETGTGSLVFATSPALAGTPTAPTAAAGTDTTQIATTAHVFAERANTATLTNKTLTSPVINTSITGTAVTQTDTDTTAGRLLKTGDGGWLSAALPTETVDADNLFGVTQIKRLGSSTANAPSTGSQWAVMNLARTASTDGQLAISTFGNAALLIRTRDDGWENIYHTGNLLGTVSQSSGVPTGAVIERDSNSNGEYVKFADGTMICTKIINRLNQAVNLSNGDIFLSSGPINVGSFAQSFEGTAHLSHTVSNIDDDLDIVLWLTNARNFSRMYIACGSSQASVDAQIRVTATGRWY
jgi:hypothetical protein